MPIFVLGERRESYSQYESDTFKCIGRFQHAVPVSNRLQDSALAESILREKGRYDARIDDYGVPHLDSEAVVRNLAKYNGASVSLDEEQLCALNWATDFVIDMFRGMTKDTRILSLDEVITRVDMDKSPGFPWNRAGYQTHQAVYDQHSGWLKDWCAGKFSGELDDEIFWNAFPKEELRTTEKIKAGKVRHISGCPTEFKLLTDMLLLEQNEAFYRQHGKTWSQVGMDAMHGGWDDLFKKLNIHYEGIEADISQMDADFQWVVANAIRDVRYELFPQEMKTPANRALLGYIYRNIYRGKQVTNEGYVWTKEHGNASGSSLTVVDNTFGTMIALAYAYYRRCIRVGEEPSFATLEHDTAAAVYGDDNTITVASNLRHVVNHDSITVGFGELGWKVTYSSTDWEPTRALTFLSRRFAFVDDRMSFAVPAPLEGWKYVASLVKKSRKNEAPAQLFIRACGLYISCFWDEAARKAIGSVLDELTPELRATPLGRAALPNRLTDRAIVTLYVGRKICGFHLRHWVAQPSAFGGIGTVEEEVARWKASTAHFPWEN